MLHHLIINVILLIAVMLSLPAKAFDLPELQQQLSLSPVVRGDFIQVREIALLDMPLQSQGQFLLSEKHGLLWEQQTPFPVSLTLAGETLRQRIPGQPETVVHANENPMAFYFSEMFLSLFHADTHVLKEQFNLSLTGDKNQWQLTLIPNAAPLTQVFKNIVLSGGDNIETLSLHELRGDKTTLTFSDIQHMPTVLSDEERLAFSH
ncbi:outer membrane lipoprotein carrier protein LolA [Enterovibrio sp. ZSDZ42]|uniref:Outer membrane lipoprotein carrier protein LolA n=1 Tax=Enterovibrio gelatinilyticus TaxID=2899819 RepID=A0ABT5QWH5_9GAMM|nr:outer membrane lipoprotein carrier protein LolA [Enterovibrio sp. ZSDZ42]MDD1791876.1 outer membrane lipoprotein carrier protein LolA [Enterovibrio sp. ZSDZ42]